MTGAMSAAYTLSRLLAIFVAMRVKTLYMLYFDFIMITLGNVLILRYANSWEPGLWVGIVILGFGFSSAFPAIYSFLEERINVSDARGVERKLSDNATKACAQLAKDSGSSPSLNRSNSFPQVTNSVCGFFMFASSVLTTVEPLLEGKYIENWPLIFVYINLVSVIVCLFLYVALHSTDIMKKKLSRRAV